MFNFKFWYVVLYSGKCGWDDSKEVMKRIYMWVLWKRI